MSEELKNFCETCYPLFVSKMKDLEAVRRDFEVVQNLYVKALDSVKSYSDQLETAKRNIEKITNAWVNDIHALQLSTIELKHSEQRRERLLEALGKIEAQKMCDLSDDLIERSMQLSGLWMSLKMIANKAIEADKEEGKK